MSLSDNLHDNLIRITFYLLIEQQTYDIAGGKSWTVFLSIPTRTKRVTIVAMVTVTILLPARQSVHVYRLVCQPNTHKPGKISYNSLILQSTEIHQVVIEIFEIENQYQQSSSKVALLHNTFDNPFKNRWALDVLKFT